VRQPVDRRRIEEFLRALGERFRHPGRLLLVGGTTVVLRDLRAQTLDIDLSADIDPAWREEFVRVVRELKESLDVNVEEVSPAEFIPLPSGHESRSVYVGRFGELEVCHFDPYSTALSKVERGTEKDFADVRAMLGAGLLVRDRLEACFKDCLERYGRESLRQDPARFRRHFESLWSTPG
jgi:hypothetical protein